MALCAFARLGVYSLGFEREPWTTRFFPFELGLFVAGLVGYRLYAATRSWPIWNRRVAIAVMVCIIYSVVDFYENPDITRQAWLYYGAMALAIPFLFRATNGNRLDGWIGDLSYPIYLIHWPVLGTVNVFVPKAYVAVTTVSMTVLLSIVFVQLVDHSLNRLRQSRYRHSEEETASTTSPNAAGSSQSERHEATKNLQAATMPAES